MAATEFADATAATDAQMPTAAQAHALTPPAGAMAAPQVAAMDTPRARTATIEKAP
jgi:hypothetical protein